MWADAIYPLGIAAIIMLSLAIQDFRSKSIHKEISYILEGILCICILANLYFNMVLSIILAVVGLVFFIVALPLLKRFLEKRGRYHFYELDQEIFLITLVGWPFISLFSFLGNQIGNIVYAAVKRELNWSAEMPQLVVYGVVWFGIAVCILALYIY